MAAWLAGSLASALSQPVLPSFSLLGSFDAGEGSGDVLAVADLNHDGRVDLVNPVAGSGTVQIFLGNGVQPRSPR